VIELSDIDYRYPKGDFRLTLRQFSVGRGRTAAIIGPSGCGKTTLLHLIAGIIPGQSGSVLVEGVDIQGLSEAERRRFRIRNIGLVFQDFALLDYLNLLDNILHPYRINPALSLTQEIKLRAHTLAESMGIGQQLKRQVNDVSYGEQQRASICRALVTEPAVLLADEPTGNLDPENKRVILDILCVYARENQATLLVSTHDHELLDAFDQVFDLRVDGQ
jgi:putative ABC transport system ATP-binding protein